MIRSENVSPHIISLSFTNDLNEDTKTNIENERYSMTTFTTKSLAEVIKPNPTVQI